MSVDIKIKGLDEALAQMENLNPKIEKELTFTLNDEGMKWRDDVIANTPIGPTGVLHESWTFEGAQKIGNGFQIELANNTQYASHVEYGHRIKGTNKKVKGKRMLKKGNIRLEQILPIALEKAMQRALGD